MFEHHTDPIASRSVFLRRLATSSGIGLGTLAASLAVGMAGYHYLEDLGWIDAFLNAAMLLGGMGPLEHERSTAGKLFEGFYAIYCGLAVISVAGVVLAPVIHRFMHKLHQPNREHAQQAAHDCKARDRQGR